MQVKLKVMAGKIAGKEIKVPVKRFLIGRSQDCHLRPKSDAISRNHSAILVNDGGVTVRDLNSRNGTWVNGKRITGDEPLANGDLLQVGKLEFQVVIEQDQPVEKTAAPKPVKESGAPVPKTVKDTLASDNSNSGEFDVSDWLDEADAAAKASREADPETRQYKLDETDRIALEKAGDEPASSAGADDEEKKKAPFQRPEKRAPGKLPDRPTTAAVNSREAAADMLKKMFNTR